MLKNKKLNEVGIEKDLLCEKNMITRRVSSVSIYNSDLPTWGVLSFFQNCIHSLKSIFNPIVLRTRLHNPKTTPSGLGV